MDWKNLVSGMAAGGISTMVLHPIDLIKVRMQADVKHDYRSHSFLYTFRQMIQRRSAFGNRVFYQGLSANLLGSVSSWGIYFMLYEWLKSKEYLRCRYFASAAIAGAVTQLFTNPIWLAKTRLCLQEAAPLRKYSGLYDCLQKVFHEEGVPGLYRGLIPGLIGVSHGAVQFSAYEYLKVKIRPYFEKDDVPFYLACSSLSKAVAVIATYPYQVFRTRVQSGKSTIRSVFTSFIEVEGIVGAFKGLGPSILRVLPATCITFVTYEFLQKSLRKIQ